MNFWNRSFSVINNMSYNYNMSIYIGNDLEDRFKALEMENVK